MLTTSEHLPHFKVHHGDAQQFGGLLEDGVLGEGGRVPISVGVAEAPHTGPVRSGTASGRCGWTPPGERGESKDFEGSHGRDESLYLLREPGLGLASERTLLNPLKAKHASTFKL